MESDTDPMSHTPPHPTPTIEGILSLLTSEIPQTDVTGSSMCPPLSSCVSLGCGASETSLGRTVHCPLPLPQVDDSHRRINGDGDVSKKSAVPSRYHQFMTSEDEATSHSSGEDEEEEEEGKQEETNISNSQSVSQEFTPQPKSETPALAKDASQVLITITTSGCQGAGLPYTVAIPYRCS